tara:strand:+ start:817 stop:1737 length:921 start_codon:yes stop_codon:yes gene_type:complete
MQILTDILSLFKRNQFVEKVNDYDAIVVGVNEAPQLTGIASPIPYKNVKLIRIKDFVNLASPQIINIPADASEAGCYSGETTDPITEEVTNNFRRLKSLSLDLTIEENGDYIEFNTTGNAVLLNQSFASPMSKFSNTPNEWGIGAETGVFGTDILQPFIGSVLYDHGVVVGNDIDTRKLVGCASQVPATVSPSGNIQIQYIAQTNVTGLTLHWKLWKLDPDDLGNNGALGTSLIQITGQGPITVQSDFSSNGVTAYGKEVIVPFTLAPNPNNAINQGDLLFLGWYYDYSGATGSSDYISINATIRS